MRIDREVLYREVIVEDDDLCGDCLHLEECPLLNSIKYGVVDIVDPDTFCIEDCESYEEGIKER